jgi:hypothetical protein
MSIENEHDGGGDELSIRDSLNAAFDEHRDAPAEPALKAAEPTAPAAPAEPKAAEPAQPGRDPSGRFAKATQTQAPAAPEAQGQAAQPGASAEPIQPPASWSAPAKAAFASLPPIVQSEIAKREADVNRGFEDRASALKRYEPLEQILAPRRDQLAARGVSEVDFVKTLFAASDWIDRDPVSALRELMRQKGVTLQHFGVQPQAGQQPQAQLPPQFQTLAREVQTLRSQLSQRDQAEQAQRLQAVQSDIQAFAADSANPYFHNVREDMIALLQSGRAKDLKDAYDKAVWANPETRALLQADAAKKAEADRLNAQRTTASGARRAAGSVAGAPGQGSAPAGAGTSNRSLRDEIAESFRSARV